MRVQNSCKLQRSVSRRTPKKTYFKFRLCILKKHLKILGWERGQVIKEEIIGDSLVLTPVESGEDIG